MSIESAEDWRGLKAAGNVVRLTLDALERRVCTGITTAQLDEIAAQVLRRYGARPAPALVYGFPGTVLISVNDEVVHGIPGGRSLVSGDVVKLDVTVELNGYYADAARTLIVGAGTETASNVVRCAEEALAAGLSVARAGRRVSEIGRAVERKVRGAGFAVIAELAGHGVGRTIHEEPTVANYYDPSQTDVLTEGLVLTIEPIVSAGSGRVYVDQDGWTVKTRDGAIAAHHEHTIVITRGTPVVLTGQHPISCTQ